VFRAGMRKKIIDLFIYETSLMRFLCSVIGPEQPSIPRPDVTVTP
jgi:hypothetical protein